MKKSKLLGILTAIGSIVMVIYSCSDDALQDSKTDGVSDATVYTSESTAIATITGIYDAFQSAYGGPDGIPAEYNTKAIQTLDRLTQDWKGNGTDEEFRQFELTPDSEIPTKLWPVHYYGIGRANVALLNLQPAIDAGNINEELGSRLIGEALVLRSIFYYYLTGTMGGVPLILEPTTGDSDFFAPRNTAEEVWNQLAFDLEDAADRLPWSYDIEKGRVTKGTAYAMLGSVYMWLGRYDDAVKAFEELEGRFSLEENFLDIHALENKNGKESLFEIQFNDNGDLGWNRNEEKTYLQSFNMPSEINGGSYGGIPTVALYDSFEAGDLRRDFTIIAPGEEHPDPLINISDYPNIQANYGGMNTLGSKEQPWLGNDGSVGRTGYYAVKTWRNPLISGWNGPNIFSGQNHIWLRYGEVLISLAEAQLKSGNGNPMSTIMRVRNRAWGGLAPVPTGDMMDIIFDEYRHELGGEFSLWLCLRRTGEVGDYMLNEFGITIPTGRDLLPIPRIQIDINPNLEQNPGY
ncbi:RagB/SusD family nutrient uptake outer membrane protein [Maribacter stanieri]|uniref:RagB/SusD family nutrient uptake outer membrane protein n=1 Tax=Maribacter stanieri TaxID=440514 RepID=UPI0030DB7AB7|tara:strand:+ start:8981 stop:10537 length:1557 start_codon:yes stop_codon:yes gene_type:complete